MRYRSVVHNGLYNRIRPVKSPAWRQERLVRYSQHVSLRFNNEQTTKSNAENARQHVDENSWSRTTTLPKSLPHKDDSTAELYTRLHRAALDGHIGFTTRRALHLVRDLGERPDARIYAALILANVSPEYGSVEVVSRLLAELHEEGIQLDSAICHNVLKVLTVHPDYALRADMIEHMRQRQMPISTDGQIDIAVSQLRDGSLESGITTLSELRQQGASIRPWVWDLAVYMLLHAGDISAALDLAMDRGAHSTGDIGATLWRNMLDTASEAHHHAATLYVWNSRVLPGSLVPSTGTLLNVLGTAAQHGDADLAMHAIRKLTEHKYAVTARDYEQLFEAHLSAEKPTLKEALLVLADMADQSIHVTKSCTRPFVLYWQEQRRSAEESFGILKDFRDQGRQIPLAILNALLEIFANEGNVTKAMEVFDSLHTFVPSQVKAEHARRTFANTETFALMYQAVRHDKAGAYRMANSLRTEQAALRIPLDALCYDRLILACLASNKLDEAMSIVAEMQHRGFQLRRGTSKLLNSLRV